MNELYTPQLSVGGKDMTQIIEGFYRYVTGKDLPYD